MMLLIYLIMFLKLKQSTGNTADCFILFQFVSVSKFF